MDEQESFSSTTADCAETAENEVTFAYSHRNQGYCPTEGQPGITQPISLFQPDTQQPVTVEYKASEISLQHNCALQQPITYDSKSTQLVTTARPRRKKFKKRDQPVIPPENRYSSSTEEIATSTAESEICDLPQDCSFTAIHVPLSCEIFTPSYCVQVTDRYDAPSPIVQRSLTPGKKNVDRDYDSISRTNLSKSTYSCMPETMISGKLLDRSDITRSDAIETSKERGESGTYIRGDSRKALGKSTKKITTRKGKEDNIGTDINREEQAGIKEGNQNGKRRAVGSEWGNIKIRPKRAIRKRQKTRKRVFEEKEGREESQPEKSEANENTKKKGSTKAAIPNCFAKQGGKLKTNEQNKGRKDETQTEAERSIKKGKEKKAEEKEIKPCEGKAKAKAVAPSVVPLEIGLNAEVSVPTVDVGVSGDIGQPSVDVSVPSKKPAFSFGFGGKGKAESKKTKKAKKGKKAKVGVDVGADVSTGVDVQVPDVAVDMHGGSGVKGGGWRFPKISLPKAKLGVGGVKGGAHVTLPSGELEVSGPKVAVPSVNADVNVPGVDVRVADPCVLFSGSAVVPGSKFSASDMSFGELPLSLPDCGHSLPVSRRSSGVSEALIVPEVPCVNFSNDVGRFSSDLQCSFDAVLNDFALVNSPSASPVSSASFASGVEPVVDFFYSASSPLAPPSSKVLDAGISEALPQVSVANSYPASAADSSSTNRAAFVKEAQSVATGVAEPLLSPTNYRDTYLHGRIDTLCSPDLHLHGTSSIPVSSDSSGTNRWMLPSGGLHKDDYIGSDVFRDQIPSALPEYSELNLSDPSNAFPVLSIHSDPTAVHSVVIDAKDGEFGRKTGATSHDLESNTNLSVLRWFGSLGRKSRGSPVKSKYVDKPASQAKNSGFKPGDVESEGAEVAGGTGRIKVKKLKKHKKDKKGAISSQQALASSNTSASVMPRTPPRILRDLSIRQTWHGSAYDQPFGNDFELDSDGVPKPPATPTGIRITPVLCDPSNYWDIRRRGAHDAAKPRPWSALEIAPPGCNFVNDDYLFPDALTPTKIPSFRGSKEVVYDVPYMDDKALPIDEPEWPLGESRRNLLSHSHKTESADRNVAQEESSIISLDDKENRHMESDGSASRFGKFHARRRIKKKEEKEAKATRSSSGSKVSGRLSAWLHRQGEYNQ